MRQIELPYALVKLEESGRVIKQSIQELPALRLRLEKYKGEPKAKEIYNDLLTMRSRLCDSLSTASLAVLELEMDELANDMIKLNQSISAFNIITPDYTKLCSVLATFLEKLPINQESRTTNASIIGRLMNNVKMGYYPTDIEHINLLARGIEPPTTAINAFDPCCGCGLALRSIAEVLGQNASVTSYGIEIDEYRAEESLSRLNRVGFGSYFHSRISKEAFHLMLLNPPYLSVTTQGGNNTRSEKRFLVDSISHLMLGGLIIYIIPFHRMDTAIARILCDNFEDITVWKFMGSEFKKYKQIAIMGIRRKRCDGSENVRDIASLALEPDKLPEITDLPTGRYILPTKLANVQLFKGSRFNVAELQAQLSQSTSFSKLFERNKLDNMEKSPLLPLSLAQIGLIGGSGLINGLVECETPHIIKGRIVKSNNAVTEENFNSRGDLVSTSITETQSNKMVFNLLTPDGFVSLTDMTNDAESSDCTEDNSYIDKTEDNDGKYTVRFPLGQTVITANARNILSDTDINNALVCHQLGDWGDVSKDDWKVNNDAIKIGERILSAYTSANGNKFWIITEWDRSCTTVLLPEDY